MQVIVSHPTGNRNVRAIIDGLNSENMLAEFNTTLATNPQSAFLKVLPHTLQHELLRRSYTLPMDKIRSHPWRELARMTLPRIGLKQLALHEHKLASIDAVYHQLDRATANRLRRISRTGNPAAAIYAYEDGAMASFSKAKQLGLKCIYDLPIAYWETARRLMQEEAMRLPEWAATLGGGINDSDEKLLRKTNEIEMADMIVVPGDFVKDSLPVHARHKKILVAPFGSPQMINIAAAITSGRNDINHQRPLRVLFAGSMGQRKGLADLFAAMRLLHEPNIELVVMGSMLAPMQFYRRQCPHFTYEPGRPHDQVLALMRSCDVFCLPSIVEGRALVTQEAMSQGLPILITSNTGGADLVVEGKTGFLVPVRSPEAIAAKLNWFLENRHLVNEMGLLAQQHAALYTWEQYARKITNAIKTFLS